MLEPLDEDVLQHVAEARLDGALIAGSTSMKSATAPICPTLPLALTSTMRAASAKPPRCVSISSSECRRAAMPASSCSRVRTSRDRHSCSSRALASSDSRAARAMRADSRPSCARCNASAAATPLRARLLELDAELARFEIEPRLFASTARSRCAAAESCAAVSAVMVLSTA